MRVNLIAQPFRGSKSSNGKVPLSLTIRPACSLPGEYQFPTDSEALMLLLRQKTDLAAPVLERFEGKLCAPVGARPLGVELSEHVLTEIGYLIDWQMSRSSLKISVRRASVALFFAVCFVPEGIGFEMAGSVRSGH
jgi:hypothetical protein